MGVDGVDGFLVGSFVGCEQGEVVSEWQRGNGVFPDLIAKLWVIFDGIYDGIEDPDEDDG